MVDIYLRGSAFNHQISYLPGVQDSVFDEAKDVEHKAEGFLRDARASTTHSKIVGPSHLTEISVEHHPPDGLVIMTAPDPLAIEFGHAPSGVFDPDEYGSVTKAPHGLYIMARAAGLGSRSVIPIGPRG